MDIQYRAEGSYLFVLRMDLLKSNLMENYFPLLQFSDTNDCVPDPCQNGGTCVDLVGSYRCDCKTGYSGTNCQTSAYLIFIII